MTPADFLLNERCFTKPFSQAFEDQSASNWLALFQRTLNGFAYLGEVFFHRKMGLRYVDACCPFLLGVLLIYPLFWPEHDLRPYMVFAGLCVVAQMGQRLSAASRRVRGDMVQSYYTGEPRLWA